MTARCEEVIVQIVVVERDEAGDKVREQVSQPIKVFRNAQTQNFWAQADKAVMELQRQEHERVVAAAKQGRSAPPDAVRKTRR
jgi:hypothetical protein